MNQKTRINRMNNQSSLRKPSHLSLVVILLVVLTGVLFFILAQRATANEILSPNAGDVPLSSKISYQGEIHHNGTAYDGSCAMKFQLFDAESGGSSVSSEESFSSINVDDGVFTVALDFGSEPFTGASRYLNIAVKCGSDSSYTTIGGRVSFNATPYALSLRPGAVISGEEMSGEVITAVNTDTGYDSVAIYGRSGDEVPVTNSMGIGVRGDSGNGIGTAGYTDFGAGLFGYAIGGSGENYGVYGATQSDAGYGIYSQGNAHVDGNLTFKPITSYISLPGAAFHPSDEGHSYINSGFSLMPQNTSYSGYLAHVQLPHNAVITKLSYSSTDWSVNNNSSVSLYRALPTGSETEMATVSSEGQSGVPATLSDSTISDPIINNKLYGYYIWASFPSPADDFVLHNVTIEYTINQPH